MAAAARASDRASRHSPRGPAPPPISSVACYAARIPLIEQRGRGVARRRRPVRGRQPCADEMQAAARPGCVALAAAAWFEARDRELRISTKLEQLKTHLKGFKSHILDLVNAQKGGDTWKKVQLEAGSYYNVLNSNVQAIEQEQGRQYQDARIIARHI